MNANSRMGCRWRLKGMDMVQLELSLEKSLGKPLQG